MPKDYRTYQEGWIGSDMHSDAIAEFSRVSHPSRRPMTTEAKKHLVIFFSIWAVLVSLLIGCTVQAVDKYPQSSQRKDLDASNPTPISSLSPLSTAPAISITTYKDYQAEQNAIKKKATRSVPSTTMAPTEPQRQPTSNRDTTTWGTNNYNWGAIQTPTTTTGRTSREGSPEPISDTYIGNRKSKKFHLPSCSYLPDQYNQVELDSREEAIEKGYTPCGHCNP